MSNNCKLALSNKYSMGDTSAVISDLTPACSHSRIFNQDYIKLRKEVGLLFSRERVVQIKSPKENYHPRGSFKRSIVLFMENPLLSA